MTEIIQPTIDRALTHVQREREILETERDAFRALLGRVSGFQIDPPGSIGVRTAGAAGTEVVTAQKSSRDLRRIRDAYHETVMAVPHYEREYGESMRENLAAEFGPTLAGHLADSEILTPTVYETFLDGCKNARDERGRLLRAVEREQDSLRRCETELTEIEAAVHDAAEDITATTGSRTLSRIDRRLGALEARCMECARDRQELLHERSGREFPGTDGFGFTEYLYTDLETTTPVLSDVAARIETIRHHRSRCLR